MPKKLHRTPRVERSLLLAAQEALRLWQPAVGPEHVFLGMLREGTGMASLVLDELGADREALRRELEDALPRGSAPAGGPRELSAEAVALLQEAAAEAHALRHRWVGQEHILLALLRAPGVVADLLRESLVTYELVLQAIPHAGAGLPENRAGAQPQIRRYNLGLPEALFAEVERLADREGTSVLEILRRSVKLGLLVDRLQSAGAVVVVREEGQERELVVL